MEEIKGDSKKGEGEEEKIVRVKVKWSTRERLKALGKKGDSYEDIISALVDIELAKREKGEGELWDELKRIADETVDDLDGEKG